MGSTGHGIMQKSRTGNVNNETFSVNRAINYKGTVPQDSGLEKPGNNKITLKIPVDNKTSVIFQFKLSKDNDEMTIIGYKNGIPEVKAKVAVDSGNPSLNALMVSGSKTEKSQALKMKQLMNMSSEISENQLGSIAQKLLRNKLKGQ